MLKLERRQLKKNKGCKLRFVIFGHFRFPSQNNICEKLVLSSSKNPQKWFYVHLGRLMHINHRNYAQLSRNEVILGSTYFIASWKLEWEHFFFDYLFATCISYFFNIDLETTCICKFCFVKFVFAWSMFVYTLFCIYILG